MPHRPRPATCWLGLIDGLLKMSNDDAQGAPITFTGMPPGGWFGEGTLLKREPYRYNIEALRKSMVAGLPIETFHWLLDRSIPFNRFVMNQLNERLGQFIAAREIDRMNDPDSRVARNLAALFHPVLYPGVGSCCASRSRSSATWSACRASASTRRCTRCRQQGLIRIEYGGVRVLDLAALRQYARSLMSDRAHVRR